MPELSSEALARRFHERLAPAYGYETRAESATGWDDIPPENRALMIATADELRRELTPQFAAEARNDPRDRVMWLFAIVAGALLVFAVVIVGLLAVFRPETDTTELAKAISTQISLIVGAVLGYAARGPNQSTGSS